MSQRYYCRQCGKIESHYFQAGEHIHGGLYYPLQLIEETMLEFYCPKCQTIEVLSPDAYDVIHHHGEHFFKLSILQGAPVDGMPYEARQFIKEVHLVEFDPNKVYLVLYDPLKIDMVAAIKNMENLKMQIPAETLFIPCRFDKNSEGFMTEMIAIESLDIIEEWLKERRAALVPEAKSCTT